MNKTLLVVDDSASMRQLVGFTLKDAGYDVLEAENGKDALEKVAVRPVELVVTDLNMPEMNGIELIRSLRSMEGYRFTPILLLTTETQEQKVVEGAAAGASGWISKPFTPEGLLGAIRKLLR